MLTRSEALRRTKQEFARARRYGYPLTIAICRLDRIDHLADIYGAESRLLLVDELSRTFQARARSTDIIGRLGEERLLWVLPHTDLPGACLAAERLRESVQEIEVSSGRRTIHVTLSAGLACYVSRNTLFFDSIMMQAEEALERAQYRGGNQIDWHPLPEAFEQAQRYNRRATDHGGSGDIDPGRTANERFATHEERAESSAARTGNEPSAPARESHAEAQGNFEQPSRAPHEPRDERARGPHHERPVAPRDERGLGASDAPNAREDDDQDTGGLDRNWPLT